MKPLHSLVLTAAFSMASLAGAQDLASLHSKMGGCQVCHGTNAVVAANVPDDEIELNKKCTTCHGDFKKLANKSLKYDPHNSHLSDRSAINCTVCHSVHSKPKLICNDCHTFDMKMPAADAPEAAKWDATIDEKAVAAAIAAPARETIDVLVIGAGSAGLNAAIAAKRAGAKVLLIEKHSYAGGNSMLAAGGYNACNTPEQAKKGIKDSVQSYVADTMKGGRGKNDPKLVQILAEQSAAGVKWLEDMGADMSDVKRSGGAAVARTHRPHGGMSVGPHIVDVLRAQAEKDGVAPRVNSRAVQLLLDKDYKISGAIVHGKHSGYYKVDAKAIVLATGGYGQNKAMIAFYRPTFKNMTSSNNITSTGDGITMALNVGASMTDIDWVQAHPTVGLDSRILISETVRGVGAVMVNVKGARFVNELTTRDRASDAILHQP